MTTSNKIYCQKVVVDPPLHRYLVECCKNHSIIYNQVLEYFKLNSDISHKEIKLYAAECLERFADRPVIKSVLFNDVYHMHKKREFRQKLIASIQYLTIIIAGDYQAKYVEYLVGRRAIRLRGVKGLIRLPEPLPEVSSEDYVYINIGYSSGSDSFELSVFHMQPEAVPA